MYQFCPGFLFSLYYNLALKQVCCQPLALMKGYHKENFHQDLCFQLIDLLTDSENCKYMLIVLYLN